MEQQLSATYLSPEPIERAAAIGIGAVAIGIGIFLAAWGISFLWRYTPPEVVVRIANPELNVVQDKPFILAQPEPLKIAPGELTIKTDPPVGNTTTASGDVIKREVTVFWSVNHRSGQVVTGWSYPDGRGGVPVVEYCYYYAAQVDGSFQRIDVARNRIPSSVTGLVPDIQGALAKCQWSQA